MWDAWQNMGGLGSLTVGSASGYTAQIQSPEDWVKFSQRDFQQQLVQQALAPSRNPPPPPAATEDEVAWLRRRVREVCWRGPAAA